MAGLLRPLFKRRRRAAGDAYHDYLAMSELQDILEQGPRTYRWATGRDGQFAEPVSHLIGVLIRDAMARAMSEFTICPDGLHTQILFGESTNEQLRLRLFYGPLLLLRLRGLAGMWGASACYPQQGAFIVRQGKSRYGIQITIEMTPWGEQATVNIAVAP